MTEKDPNGIAPNAPGAKLDDGKADMSLLQFFARALEQVALVGTLGQEKYTRGGFLEVPNGAVRYTAAMMRHFGKERTEGTYDADPWYKTEKGAKWVGRVRHDAQVAWNALARLELTLIEEDETPTVAECFDRFKAARDKLNSGKIDDRKGGYLDPSEEFGETARDVFDERKATGGFFMPASTADEIRAHCKPGQSIEISHTIEPVPLDSERTVFGPGKGVGYAHITFEDGREIEIDKDNPGVQVLIVDGAEEMEAIERVAKMYLGGLISW